MTMTERKSDRDGFTLAELLIVVAIIGVLVAISIPIFNKQLEKSREAHDIYTMRAVAALAVDYYYSGAVNQEGADALGLKWWPNKTNPNAAGVYDPTTGGFVPERKDVEKAYGKGTAIDGGTKFNEGTNSKGAYNAGADYRESVCMISIYPTGNDAHIDIYWKVKDGGGNDFTGGNVGNNPMYSLRLSIN